MSILTHLGSDGVLVTREGLALDQHFVAQWRGVVEGSHQQVQVHRQSVHHCHLAAAEVS